MPKVKISEYSATANSNTDVASINIDEGCAPSGINNAIRAVMGHLKDFQQGTYGDPFNGPVNGTLGATTASTANVTTLTTSSTVTHNGGTANGVAYLNGSKVLTTGSALTFSGSALAVTGTISSNNGSANNLLSINGDGAIQSGVQFKANGAGPYTTIYFDNSTNHTYYKNLASGGHLFFNNTTQAMTLDASGNLGIGTTSPTSKLSIESALAYSGLSLNSTGGTSGRNRKYIIQTDTIGDTVNGVLAFYDATASAYRMVLDASGNLLVGTTSGGGARIRAQGASTTGSDYAFVAQDSAGTALLLLRNDGYIQTSTTGSGPYANTTASAANMFVSSGGVLQRSTSSLKYKTNVQDATHGLADLLQLRSVTYEGKAETDAGKTFGGLIAEEVHEAGLTEFVQYAEDGTPDALAYGNIVSLCIKAIQELKAEFDAYKASHP